MIRSSNIITMVPEALEIMTLEQANSIVGLVTDKHSIEVRKGGFDLPSGYLEFTLKYAGETTEIAGGIDTNGDVST